MHAQTLRHSLGLFETSRRGAGSMNDASTIGDRLKRLRGDRGLTQEELAEASGVSYSVISMLERNKRTSARLSTISRLAVALDVEIGELVDRRDHLHGDRDGGRVLAVRDALLNPALLPGVDSADGGEPTPLAELNAHVIAAWEHYWAGRFGELLASLPGLVGEARITHRALGVAAVEPLALAYDVAANLMVQIGRTDLGAVAAERAIVLAHGGDDPLLWSTLHTSYARVLLFQGRYEEAVSLVTSMAERIQPSFSDGDEEITAWGKLLLTAIAPTVALDRDPAELLNLAEAGAVRVRRPMRTYHHNAFSLPAVHMQAAYAYSTLRKPGQALQAAGQIRPGDLDGINWGAHLMDVAQAHVEAGHRKTAIRALLEAREVSPVWFRHQRVAKDAVAEIRERETRLSPELKSLARSLDI
jgi:transcriptional regulator with XRE-family HTH domain